MNHLALVESLNSRRSSEAKSAPATRMDGRKAPVWGVSCSHCPEDGKKAPGFLSARFEALSDRAVSLEGREGQVRSTSSPVSFQTVNVEDGPGRNLLRITVKSCYKMLNKRSLATSQKRVGIRRLFFEVTPVFGACGTLKPAPSLSHGPQGMVPKPPPGEQP